MGETTSAASYTKYEDYYCYYSVAHQGPWVAVVVLPCHRHMAPAYLSIWTRCLQELQRLPAVLSNSAEEKAAYQKITAHLKDWDALPAVSASAWRALVLDLKVRMAVHCGPAGNLAECRHQNTHGFPY